MSEYTSYAIIHTEDIRQTYNSLTDLGITSVLLSDWGHPLYRYDSVDSLDKAWKDLPYKYQWLICMSKSKPCSEIELFGKSVYLMIDENPDRWFLGMYTDNDSHAYLFSDKPWGDLCAKGSRKNNFTFLRANPSRPAALRKLDISRYACAFAPCWTGALTLKNTNLFLREP